VFICVVVATYFLGWLFARPDAPAA